MTDRPEPAATGGTSAEGAPAQAAPAPAAPPPPTGKKAARAPLAFMALLAAEIAAVAVLWTGFGYSESDVLWVFGTVLAVFTLQTAGALIGVRALRPSWKLLVSTQLLLFGAGVITYSIVAGAGAKAAGVGLVAALVPAPLLVGSFLWLSRHRHHGWKPLTFAFLWGAAVSTAVSMVVNTGAAYYFRENGISENWAAVASAPVIEEITKFLAPLAILLFASRHIRNGLDALVFAGLSAAGFAIVENVLYASGTYLSGPSIYGEGTGGASVTLLVIVRGILTMFAHPLFTCTVAFGMAKAVGKPAGRRLLWSLTCLPFAMGLHALWNWSAVFGAQHGMADLFFSVYVALLMPLFFGLLGYALAVRAKVAKLTYQRLQGFVASGHVAPPEAAMLASYNRRARARAWARRTGGSPGEKAMKRFQRLGDAVADGTAYGTTREELTARLTEMNELRRGHFLADPTMPVTVWDGRSYHVTFPDAKVREVSGQGRDLMPIPVSAESVHRAAYGA
ncbi:PrsW family intramembrane metalloprotease [Salininema proteolyticum]|uniref:PrsW family intramembrane metalloprotease n=1 Tax=Salininema proteolyticum TaxID=1607685 RepID=A0ABV8U2T8_9ACTN